MNHQVSKLRRYLAALLRPRALLVGIAVFNYVTYYIEARRLEGISSCFGEPWYRSPLWAHLPLLLLPAALSVYVGRWWGYLTAVALSAPVLYQGVVVDLSLLGIYSWLDWAGHQSGLAMQYVLAAAVMSFAVKGTARLMKRNLRRSDVMKQNLPWRSQAQMRYRISH